MLGANCRHFKDLLVPQVLLVMSSLFLFQRSEANEAAYSFFKHGRLSRQGEGRNAAIGGQLLSLALCPALT